VPTEAPTTTPTADPGGSLRILLDEEYGVDVGADASPATIIKAINRLVEEARGMTCDSEGKLSEIRMSDMGLDGELPTELEYLPDLKYLDLSNNDMKGTIPGEIYGLKELRGSTCTIISSQEPSQRQKVSTQVDDESQEKKQDSANPFASGVD
jgi:hypothetical protein